MAYKRAEPHSAGRETLLLGMQTFVVSKWYMSLVSQLEGCGSMMTGRSTWPLAVSSARYFAASGTWGVQTRGRYGTLAPYETDRSMYLPPLGSGSLGHCASSPVVPPWPCPRPRSVAVRDPRRGRWAHTVHWTTSAWRCQVKYPSPSPSRSSHQWARRAVGPRRRQRLSRVLLRRLHAYPPSQCPTGPAMELHPTHRLPAGPKLHQWARHPIPRPMPSRGCLSKASSRVPDPVVAEPRSRAKLVVQRCKSFFQRLSHFTNHNSNNTKHPRSSMERRNPRLSSKRWSLECFVWPKVR